MQFSVAGRLWLPLALLATACAQDALTSIEYPPDPDICDGIDNDEDPETADGSGDPALGNACDGEDADLCNEGGLVCREGSLVCDDTSDDNLELCDGIDNDCDPETADGSDVLQMPSISACGTSWDRRPIVEFDPLPADHSYELYQDSEDTPFTTVTLEGQNYFRPAEAIGPGAPPPGEATEIHLVSCAEGDGARCCGTGPSVTVQLIESCTTPQTPTSDNIIVSEYVTDGDGPCPGAECEAGEAFEVTNLSHCPLTLDGHHISYCNPDTCTTFRWMNFDATAVVPPRGVYIAAREHGLSQCDYPFWGDNDSGPHGLNISVLELESNSPLMGGWFNNHGGGKIRIATGEFVDMTTGETLSIIDPYLGIAAECESIGFNAWDECGNVTSTSLPEDILAPNQLGRLWHPCDAVTEPFPESCD